MASAEKLGCVIKLIAWMKLGKDGSVAAGVEPCLVPKANQLASVDDVFNAVLVKGDMLGDVVFYGKGAGKLPTASVLISAITALKGKEWTIAEVGGLLEMLFEKQYILTETVSTETRYRSETRTGYYTDAEGNLHSYEYTVQVPYTYYICTVKLENFNLSHVPVYIMSQDQLSLYAMYMATLGNRPDLFGGSEYIGKYYTADYEKYEIPPEALEDAQFAAIIKEAEKYLGYPYIWGGSTPATSFDCSGFVSYVYNNCGVGWSFGRLGASGLLGICTRVSAANVRPGDLVFFQGTYDTTGASHVGIYVGNNMMLHCGDPIQYTSLNSSYWQSHFLAYGRVPAP